MAIHFALKKAIQYTTLVSLFLPTIQQWSPILTNKEEHIPLNYAWRHSNFSIGAWNMILYQNSSYSSQIQYISTQSLECDLSIQNGLWISWLGIPFFKCSVFPMLICLKLVQSQTPIVCISISGQSSFSDICIINELELSLCICISTNNSDTIYSSQGMSVLVWNSSYCSCLASMSLVLRGVTTTSISSISSSAPSKVTNTSRRKIPTSKLPASVAQLDAPSNLRPGGHGFNPRRGW